MRGLLLRRCVFELTTPQRHGGIFQHFWATDHKINFSTNVSTWKSILESPTIKRVLFRGMGIFPSWNNMGASIVRKESFIWSIGECHVKSEIANYVNFARRMRLPALYFQLGDHIPTSATMASYQTSIISLGVQPSTNGREPDDFHLLAMTQELSIDLPLSNRVANQISYEKNQTRKQFSVCVLYPVCSMHFVLTGSWVELSSFESVR